MIYRKLGRTGLSASILGFGAMRLPMKGEGDAQKVDRELAIPMIHRAFNSGVNYIDTAVGYCNSDSQRTVGEALKGWREKIILSTKNPCYELDEKAWWKNLEDSLERLQVQHIDIYNHHGINWKSWTEKVEPFLSKLMMKAKDQKLIRHICFSFHDSNENLKKLIETGYPDVITLQYNLLDRSNEEGIALAHEKGMGVVVMGPVGGGRLGVSSEVLEKLIPGTNRVPALALRFVLSNPHVCIALSGMSTMEQVQENLEIASDNKPFTDEELDIISEHLQKLKKMAELYCTGCNYCMPCPKDVAIPKIFERYNRGRVYGLWDNAKKAYSDLGKVQWDKGSKADACVNCGLCEDKCPQKIPIRKMLAEAHKRLS
ncbi:MAG TPA: aldo/keto reductase [Lentisphaeria bacterium]|nr:MAG: aldo/keto reductase [Lentisphaerae bacterium GWF2_50_93]HCE43052.1 aldo/keto reductase [Lentisphaeria bacterium]